MAAIIEVKNLGKSYNITHQRGSYVALRDVLANIAKAPFRFLRRRLQAATGRAGREEFWALRDISFQVQRGEVIGIIGKNGAGKSTLLKILSQITPPTTGEIVVRGRVGALLEVGTGFHPELSGRENIFLNGAILGMPRAEIIKKFDKIVEFAGIEKFLDTPVKYYSSGMYVRLAFSVAAHMEPDILVVDEVLAVGDGEFQKKCLGKLDEVTKKEGRTVLFVSHNMAAIKALCSKCLLLEDGRVKNFGPTEAILAEYVSEMKAVASVAVSARDRKGGSGSARVDTISLLGEDGQLKNSFAINEPLRLKVDFTVNKPEAKYSFFVVFSDGAGREIVSSFQKDLGIMNGLAAGPQTMEIEYGELGLLPGRYLVMLGIFEHSNLNFEFADWVDNCLAFDISPAFRGGQAYDHRLGIVDKKPVWRAGGQIYGK